MVAALFLSKYASCTAPRQNKVSMQTAAVSLCHSSVNNMTCLNCHFASDLPNAHCRRGKHDCATDAIMHACIHSAQTEFWIDRHDDPQKYLCRWVEVSTGWQLPTVLDVALMGGLVTLFSGYIL